MAQQPQQFLSLPFSDAKTKLGDVVHKTESVLDWVVNDGAWIIPDQYEAGLADLLKILKAADALLNKT